VLAAVAIDSGLRPVPAPDANDPTGYWSHAMPRHPTDKQDLTA
jgi:hypothetical protein